MRQEYGTDAAVSKFWFKDAANDTAKGFDVVHLSTGRTTQGELHLWLGEAKFYGNLNQAVTAAIESVREHLEANYLKSEFMLVSSKVDREAPYASVLLELLNKKTPLDQVFSVLHIPVLVTYDSSALTRHDRHSEQYFSELRSEVSEAWAPFSQAFEAPPATIDVIFIPLLEKSKFVKELHERLKVWQAM